MQWTARLCKLHSQAHSCLLLFHHHCSPHGAPPWVRSTLRPHGWLFQCSDLRPGVPCVKLSPLSPFLRVSGGFWKPSGGSAGIQCSSFRISPSRGPPSHFSVVWVLRHCRSFYRALWGGIIRHLMLFAHSKAVIFT